MAKSMGHRIHCIDLSPVTMTVGSKDVDQAKKAKIISQWYDAMHTCGFVVIKGTGISSGLINRINSEMEIFFNRPEVDKLIYSRGKYGCPEGGYTPFGKEAVASSLTPSAAVKPDPVESFVFPHPPEKNSADDFCFPSVEEYSLKMEILLSLLHRITAESLSLPVENFFEEFYSLKESTSRNGNTLRLAYYPPASRGVTDMQIAYGAHTDYQGYTILRPDPDDWGLHPGGLECLVQEGEKAETWVPIDLRAFRDSAGHENELFVVNAGDLMQHWTNDVFKSPIHRVVSGGSPKARKSIVFFSGPKADSICVPIPECIEDGKESNYLPVKAEDHLMEKLKRTRN
jgi:isopenicillin N synthase-like dioxygenase